MNYSDSFMPLEYLKERVGLGKFLVGWLLFLAQIVAKARDISHLNDNIKRYDQPLYSN